MGWKTGFGRHDIVWSARRRWGVLSLVGTERKKAAAMRRMRRESRFAEYLRHVDC
jgi:hypothetical protein